MTQVIVTDNSSITVVEAPPEATIVTAVTEGPQGPFPRRLGDIHNVDTSAVNDGSVLYYDESEEVFRADSTWTTTSLTDGGNF